MSKEMQNNITLGLIQMNCSDNLEQNLAKALTQIKEAANKGAQIICLQELFKSRYFCQKNDDKHFELAESVPGPITEALCNAAQESGVVVVASVFEKGNDGKFYNTAVVIDADGSLLGKYRKVHIPDDPDNYYSEMYYFTPGDKGFKCFNTRFANVGVLVCWDQWYPEAARAVALEGADLIFYPTAIGWQLGEKGNSVGSAEFDAWVTVQRSHAIANGVFVAATNRVGLEDKIDFWGGSFVADPYGRIISQASQDCEEILMVSCKLDTIKEFRKDWPFLNCRRMDAYLPHLKK